MSAPNSTQIKRARDAALGKAVKTASLLHQDLVCLRANLHFPGMTRIRVYLAQLNQRVHEANAYDNALRGEGSES
jgi:hypothetical protein